MKSARTDPRRRPHARASPHTARVQSRTRLHVVAAAPDRIATRAAMTPCMPRVSAAKPRRIAVTACAIPADDGGIAHGARGAPNAVGDGSAATRRGGHGAAAIPVTARRTSNVARGSSHRAPPISASSHPASLAAGRIPPLPDAISPRPGPTAASPAVMSNAAGRIPAGPDSTPLGARAIPPPAGAIPHRAGLISNVFRVRDPLNPATPHATIGSFPRARKETFQLSYRGVRADIAGQPAGISRRPTMRWFALSNGLVLLYRDTSTALRPNDRTAWAADRDEQIAPRRSRHSARCRA